LQRAAVFLWQAALPWAVAAVAAAATAAAAVAVPPPPQLQSAPLHPFSYALVPLPAFPHDLRAVSGPSSLPLAVPPFSCPALLVSSLPFAPPFPPDCRRLSLPPITLPVGPPGLPLPLASCRPSSFPKPLSGCPECRACALPRSPLAWSVSPRLPPRELPQLPCAPVVVAFPPACLAAFTSSCAGVGAGFLPRLCFVVGACKLPVPLPAWLRGPVRAPSPLPACLSLRCFALVVAVVPACLAAFTSSLCRGGCFAVALLGGAVFWQGPLFACAFFPFGGWLAAVCVLIAGGRCIDPTATRTPGPSRTAQPPAVHATVVFGVGPTRRPPLPLPLSAPELASLCCCAACTPPSLTQLCCILAVSMVEGSAPARLTCGPHVTLSQSVRLDFETSQPEVSSSNLAETLVRISPLSFPPSVSAVYGGGSVRPAKHAAWRLGYGANESRRQIVLHCSASG